MSDPSIWTARDLRFSDKGYLIIDAVPDCGNRKKWAGEMEFRIRPEMLVTLREQAESQAKKDNLKDIAKSEMTDFLRDARKEYQEKRQTLAKQLNLPEDDMPRPSAYSYFVEDEDEDEYEPF